MTPPLIIGLDAKRVVSNGTGLGSYGRTLVNDLSADDSLSLRLYAPDGGRSDLRSQVVQRRNVVFCHPRQSAFPLSKQLWRSATVVRDLCRDGVQLYHGLSGELPLGIRKSGIKSVVTIHDLIFLRHPEFYNWIDTKIYAWKFRQTVRQADRIIAISECTKRDIIAYGGVDESLVTVIYQSCAPKFTTAISADAKAEARQRYSLPRRYILTVGTIEARKNALLTVKALARLPQDVSLVLVGKPTAYSRTLVDHARQTGVADRLLLLHGVPDAALPAIYAQAEAFVYPSRYEGFGIPIIEAIYSGLPVVACTGSCLEEAGGPDCLYVSPDDDAQLAAAVRQVLMGADGREQRIARSRQYVRRFEATDVAGQVAALYHELLD